jgi:hypothetical protein
MSNGSIILNSEICLISTNIFPFFLCRILQQTDNQQDQQNANNNEAVGTFTSHIGTIDFACHIVFVIATIAVAHLDAVRHIFEWITCRINFTFKSLLGAETTTAQNLKM